MTLQPHAWLQLAKNVLSQEVVNRTVHSREIDYARIQEALRYIECAENRFTELALELSGKVREE